MKILALDTSSRVAAAAVLDQDQLLGEFIINYKLTHSQTLMPLIDRLLASVELKPSDIDLFAASTGPGSFTGLRIGVVTVKGLAYAAGKKVIGIPSLDGLAANIPFTDKLICPIMDARNNQVFTALYDWKSRGYAGESLRVTDYMGLEIGELAELLLNKTQQTNQDVVFLGDGVHLHRDFFKEKLKDRCFIAPQSSLLHRASSIAQLAMIRADRGEIMEPAELAPFYLRKSQAERLHG